MKKASVIPSLIAAGFAADTAVAASETNDGHEVGSTKPLFDVFRLDHTYDLAQHRSHASHGSHRSHRSASGGGYLVPKRTQAVLTTPSRNLSSTPPSSVLPSSPAAAKKTLPGNSHKFRRIAREVQTALYVKGYYTGAIDGLVGTQTRSAISKMQADYGLKITGGITPEVLNAFSIKAD